MQMNATSQSSPPSPGCGWPAKVVGTPAWWFSTDLLALKNQMVQEENLSFGR